MWYKTQDVSLSTIEEIEGYTMMLPLISFLYSCTDSAGGSIDTHCCRGPGYCNERDEGWTNIDVGKGPCKGLK